MKQYILYILVVCNFGMLRASGQAATTIGSLRFLGAYNIPYNKRFNGTTIGGLSGIDYDAAKKVYYLISDDRSEMNPVRYYTAKIFINPHGIDSVEMVDVTTIRQPNGNPYPNAKQDPQHTPDPEALRYNAKENTMV